MLQSDKRIIDVTLGELVQLLDERYLNAGTSVLSLAMPQVEGEEKEKMDVAECAKLTDYTPGYIRQLVFKKLIPYYKIRKQLHFRRSEITAWLYKKKVTPVDELAERYITNNSPNQKIYL